MDLGSTLALPFLPQIALDRPLPLFEIYEFMILSRVLGHRDK